MSLNMNDVSDLTITEGDVRTIHDSSDRLLWGKLSYNTYYAGDTKQQTYSGKNLFDTSSYTVDNNQLTIIRNADGSFTVNGTSTIATNIWFTNTIILNGDYTVAQIGDKTTNQGYVNLYQDSEHTTNIAYFNTAANNHYKNFTTTQTSLSQRLSVPEGTYNNFVFRIILVKGTYDLSNIGDFEQYVGGIPAPNPDYPQTVNVVTGQQTITINGEDFTLNLGVAELCKIGNYQDYIYKSGDDWYVHKAIQKVLVDGVNIKATSYHNVNGGINGFRINVASAGDLGYTDLLSDNFNYIAWNTYQSSNRKYGEISTNIGSSPTTIYITQPDSNTGTTLDSTGTANMNTWFSSHNTLIYYALATPTDTKITDATLISQLNNINEWLTRYGYNSIVSGNLPLIIIQNNL